MRLKVDGDVVFDKSDPDGRAVTGAVLQTGLTGEAHDRAYAIIDGIDGRAVFVELGVAGDVEELKRGTIVTVSPPNFEPKPSDLTIDRIARANGGTYSAGLHQADDPRSTPELVASHVRRLEALRRAVTSGGRPMRSGKFHRTIWIGRVRMSELRRGSGLQIYWFARS